MTLRIIETKMRFKIFIVIFLPFYQALQWTFHGDKALDVTPGSSTTISTFSTLEEAKNECLNHPECGGITTNNGDYELRKGTVLISWTTSTTYMKSFIQWIEHPGKVLSGSSLGSFNDLVQAKNKCIDRLNNSLFSEYDFSQFMTLELSKLNFNLCEEVLESGEGHCSGIIEPHCCGGEYHVKSNPANPAPYFHGTWPNENSWTFYWYTEEDFEIDISFEK